MYKRVKIKKLGRTRSNRHALIQNQLRSLFNSGKVQTTTTKAKVLSGEAQSLLKKMTSKDPNSARLVSRVLGNREIADNAIAYAKGDNAVVKIVKVGFRDGDNAQVSRVELLGYTLPKKVVAKKISKKSAETKKEVKTEPKKAVGGKRVAERKSLGKRITEAVTARRQRATSRSGL